MSRKWLAVLWAALLLAVGGVAGWAAKTLLEPPDEVASEATYATVRAEQGSVSAISRIRAFAQWEPMSAGVNSASGVVTEVALASGEASTCDVLYRVNEQPVVIAEGEIPAYRAMSEGDTGRDVVQLQEMLIACGYSTGDADGDFGPSTTAAVEAWQDDLGVEDTGVVALGSIVFVSTLPTQVLLDSDRLRVGSSLNGGEDVVSVLSDSPRFLSQISDRQVAQLEEGQRAFLETPFGEFEAVIGSIEGADSQQFTVTYVSVDDEPLCGDACAEFPISPATSFEARVELVAPAEGVVIPSAALVTDASGGVIVVTDTGERISVTIRNQAQGQAVVDGLHSGTLLRVPGDLDD